MSFLKNGQVFPNIEIAAVGGGSIKLPSDLAGSFGVVLIYRGHWCPFCNEQLGSFQAESAKLKELGVKVVAFSVDDEFDDRGTRRKASSRLQAWSQRFG